MTEGDDADRIFAKLNINSGVALGCIALGIAIWVLVPYQVEEPPAFFGQSSSGISPKLFPRIAAAGLIVTAIAYFFASLRMDEPNLLRELPASAYLNLA